MQKTIIALLGAASAVFSIAVILRCLKSCRSSRRTNTKAATFKDLYDDNEMEVLLF